MVQILNFVTCKWDKENITQTFNSYDKKMINSWKWPFLDIFAKKWKFCYLVFCWKLAQIFAGLRFQTDISGVKFWGGVKWLCSLNWNGQKWPKMAKNNQSIIFFAKLLNFALKYTICYEKVFQIARFPYLARFSYF